MKNFIGFLSVALLFFSCGSSENDSISVSDGGVSQGGSLARFAIVGDYLYVVNDMSLIPVDIQQLDNPKKLTERELGVNIETIFPYQGNLFIGSASAVYIYSLADPQEPSRLSIYEHSTGCDPVVVRGNYAYVTLREGESCGNIVDINVLEVVDVSNLRQPFQVASINMGNPRGLGIGCNNKLFVCEGPGGFVQFDITNPQNPIPEQIYTEHAANDVIVDDELLIVTGDDGLYQYSCAGDSLELLSVLPISL